MKKKSDYCWEARTDAKIGQFSCCEKTMIIHFVVTEDLLYKIDKSQMQFSMLLQLQISPNWQG